MPKISVIVPVYNSEKYLPRCLDSIVNQTLEDIEIICVDDGSTDGSAAILNEYAIRDERIKVIIQKNGGSSLARNIGIARATGKYIGFVDADDHIKNDFYKHLYLAAELYRADVVQCGYYKCSDTATEKDVRENPLVSSDLCRILDNMKKCYVWNKIWRTEFLQQNDILFYDGIFYQDILFNVKTVCLKPLYCFIDYSGYFYWCSNASSSTNHKDKLSKRQHDKITALKKSLECAKSSGLADFEYKYLQNFLIERFIGKNEMSSKDLYRQYQTVFNHNFRLRQKYYKFKIKQIIQNIF